jgi:hypothetical protein
MALNEQWADVGFAEAGVALLAGNASQLQHWLSLFVGRSWVRGESAAW